MDQLTPDINFGEISVSRVLPAEFSPWDFDPSSINWDDVPDLEEVIEYIESIYYSLEKKDDSEKKPPYNWVLDYIVSERYKAKMRLLILLFCTKIISIKKLMHELTASISLIFGMCGSCVSFIYSAIFGNSSNRIFSV